MNEGNKIISPPTSALNTHKIPPRVPGTRQKFMDPDFKVKSQQVLQQKVDNSINVPQNETGLKFRPGSGRRDVAIKNTNK